jgi:putative transposase
VRFRFIEAEKANFPIAALCRVLRVRRSGFYAWRKRAPSMRARTNVAARVHIRAIYRQHRRRYGSPRVYRELRAQGMVAVGRHRVARLMREEGLRARARRRYSVTTDSSHCHRVAPNRVGRNFSAAAPNRVWLTDITYLETGEGWLYLTCFLDVYSRRVVGWVVDDGLQAEPICGALSEAIARRRPQPGLLVHSDRGRQYAGEHFQRLLRQRGFLSSMSRKANCWDNAPMESFFATLKREIADGPWPTKSAAEADLVAYFTYYNHERRHSALDYRTPAEYESAAL